MTCTLCERLVVAFELHTRPVPKGRPRFGNGRTYTPARTVAYETAVNLACRNAMHGRAPHDGDVALVALFEQRDAKASDVDNLAKALLDGIEGVAFTNDRQVMEIRARRVIRADVDRVSVAVLAVAS